MLGNLTIKLRASHSDPTIKPPVRVKLRGRPKTKRIRKGALTKVARNCGTEW